MGGVAIGCYHEHHSFRFFQSKYVFRLKESKEFSPMELMHDGKFISFMIAMCPWSLRRHNQTECKSFVSVISLAWPGDPIN